MSGSEKLIESQRAKAAIRESEAHYRAVVAAATEPITAQADDDTQKKAVAAHPIAFLNHPFNE
jgi:hypothetical protein